MYIPSWKQPMYDELRRQLDEQDKRDGVDLTIRCGACGLVRSLHANPHLYPWSLYSETDTGGRSRFVVDDYLRSTVCPECNAVGCHRLVAQRGPR